MILQEEKDNLNDRSFAFHYRYPFFSQGFLVCFPALSFSLHRFGALNRGNRKEERKRLCCRNIRKRRQKRPTMHVCVARNARIFFCGSLRRVVGVLLVKREKKKKQLWWYVRSTVLNFLEALGTIAAFFFLSGSVAYSDCFFFFRTVSRAIPDAYCCFCLCSFWIWVYLLLWMLSIYMLVCVCANLLLKVVGASYTYESAFVHRRSSV